MGIWFRQSCYVRWRGPIKIAPRKNAENAQPFPCDDVCALLLDVCLCNAQQDSTSYPRADQFKSPDGMLVVVIQTTKAPEGTRESRIEVKTRTGRLLAKLNYGSKDGEHGYGVSKAVWTPDSQFFSALK